MFCVIIFLKKWCHVGEHPSVVLGEMNNSWREVWGGRALAWGVNPAQGPSWLWERDLYLTLSFFMSRTQTHQQWTKWSINRPSALINSPLVSVWLGRAHGAVHILSLIRLELMWFSEWPIISLMQLSRALSVFVHTSSKCEQNCHYFLSTYVCQTCQRIPGPQMATR